MSAGEVTDSIRAGSSSLPSAVLPETPQAAAEAGQKALARESNKNAEHPYIDKADFGLKAGEFRPPQELRDQFQGMMKTIASQIEQYQRTGKPLTENQRKFLIIYKNSGDKLLDTADGWSLANLVIEEEMFLRLASIGQDIFHNITKRGLPSTPTNEITLSREEIRGLVNKYGLDVLKYGSIAATAPLSLPIIGIIRLIQSAGRHDLKETTIRINDWQIGTDGLPPAVRQYMDYLAPTINAEHTRKFIADAQKARLGIDIKQPAKGGKPETAVGFYQLLGVNPEDLETVTPWERFGKSPSFPGSLDMTPEPGNINQVQENIGTEWMRIRRQAFKEIREIRGGANVPQNELAQAFYEAQQKTIGHFLDSHLKVMAEAKFGNTSGENGTIKTLQERVSSMRAPQEVAKMKTKTETDVARLTTTISEQEVRLKNLQEALCLKKEGIITLEATKGVDKQERDFWKDIVRKQTAERDAYIQQRNTLEADFNTKINDPNIAVDVKTQLITIKGQQINAYNERIADTQKRINEATAKLAEAIKQIVKLPTLEAEIKALEGVAALETAPAVVGEIAKLQAGINTNKTELENKQADLDKGVEATIQARIDKIETVVRCLQGYDRVVGDPLFHPVEKMLTTQDLTSTVQKDEGGAKYPEGYLRFLDHLFQYTNQAKRTESFKTSRALLSPKELGTILRDRFFLTTAAGDLLQVNGNSDLQVVFMTLGAKNISQTRFASVFLNVLEFIEEKGKKIK